MQRTISIMWWVALFIALATAAQANIIRPTDLCVPYTPILDMRAHSMTLPTYDYNQTGNMFEHKNWVDSMMRLDVQDGLAYWRDFTPAYVNFIKADICSFPSHSAFPVPEPGTMVLVGIGIIGVSFFFRKQFSR